MSARIACIVLDCAEPEGLASFYSALLVMPKRRIDSHGRVVVGSGSAPDLAFRAVAHYRPPTWPALDFPQQLHLDIPVQDAEQTSEVVLRLGGKRLPATGGDCPVFADPAGHPFCLCTNPDIANGQAQPGKIGNIVFDCFADPRALASFYAALLDMPNRPMDSDGWVLITHTDGKLPRLAFQGADGNKPSWPDPKRPQQIHLDIATHDLEADENLVRNMGATKLATGGPNHLVYEDPEGHPFCLCRPG